MSKKLKPRNIDLESVRSFREHYAYKRRFYMTPKERAVAALTLKVPDMVPTFELDFQLEEEMFGKRFYTDDLLPERKGRENIQAG